MSGALLVGALLVGFVVLVAALLAAGYAGIKLFQQTMARANDTMLQTMRETVAATRRAIEGDVPQDDSAALGGANELLLPALEDQRAWFMDSEENDISPDIGEVGPEPWNATNDLRQRTASISPGDGIPDIGVKGARGG